MENKKPLSEKVQRTDEEKEKCDQNTSKIIEKEKRNQSAK